MNHHGPLGTIYYSINIPDKQLRVVEGQLRAENPATEGTLPKKIVVDG
jgi:hypothetical protein